MKSYIEPLNAADALDVLDLDGFADAGELAEENARLYGAPSVADLAETVWAAPAWSP